MAYDQYGNWNPFASAVDEMNALGGTQFQQPGAANPQQWGPTVNYGVENPSNYSPTTQFNTGIGSDWLKNMDQWKDVRTGQLGYDPTAADGLERWLTNSNTETMETTLNPEWLKATNQGADGFSYTGEDGKRYIIRPQQGYQNAEGLKGYTVTPLHQNNEIVGYNGIPHDQFDTEGKYTGTALPQNQGHGKFWRDAALMAGMVATAGILGPYIGPYLGGTAASGAAGAAAGGGGSLGTVGGAAGAAGGAGGTAGVVGGSGAFVGEGAASGIGAWDAALANAIPAGSAGAGGAGLVGQAAPTAPGYGAPASSGGSLFGSGSGGMFGGSVSIPGIGSVSTSQLMQVAMPLLGALGGSQEQEVETTSTKELPEWLQQPVYGPGGLIPNTNALLQQQMGGGVNMNNPGGLLAPPKSSSRKKPKRRGLL